MWRKDRGMGRGMDVVTFEDRLPQTLKLFRYGPDEICRGVDLTKDLPSLRGQAAIDFVKENYI